MKKFLLGLLALVSISSFAENECIIYDQYELYTKNITTILEKKGFSITSEFPYGKEYFTIHSDNTWNKTAGEALKAQLYCFEITVDTYGIRAKVNLGHSILNFRSVDEVYGNLFFNCSDTSDFKFQEREKESLRNAAEKLDHCESYIKRLDSL